MIGPGTGVAPFRAFTQERRATGATGRSWLFFGDQHFTHDFLYQLEWQDALQDGSLTRIDVAFSRDQPEKIYVQDRIREHQREVVDWIESGATLYVCGDAKAMAKDVRRALVGAYAEVKALSDARRPAMPSPSWSAPAATCRTSTRAANTRSGPARRSASCSRIRIAMTEITPPPADDAIETPAHDTLSRNEHIKEASGYLRGTLAEGLLAHATGAISEDDGQLVKFHGMYLQDDRDLRAERTRKKLEKAYSFMIRLRIPGGVVTPAQWLVLDDIATTYANGSLRVTTRQTFQYHGVIKSNLKRTMRAIDGALLDTIAACGDVNRNVLSASNPHQSNAHAAAYDLAREISDGLLPKTGAWREIWLDGEKVVGGEPEETIYGKTYLPRKFKTVIAVPPSNDVDVFAHDLGFVAILNKAGHLRGWTVTVGGGNGHDPWRAGHLPAHRRPDAVLRAGPGAEGCRGCHDGATGLGRPHQPQGRAAEIHHREIRLGRVPGRSGKNAPGGPSPTRSHSPSPATVTFSAGPRATTAAITSRCSCPAGASGTCPAAPSG